MPLYEYECDACGHRFEVIRKFSDPPLETCEKCNGPVRKLLSSPAIQFKGSGWYITDYARAGKTEGKPEGGTSSPGGDSKTAPTEAKSDSTSETKTESKTEAKTEAKPVAKSAPSSTS
jgi:putative FmdB family regulatory protein